MSDIDKEEKPTFDFDAQRVRSTEQFARKRALYEDFAQAVKKILDVATKSRDLRINEIQFRAKEVETFGKKAVTPSPNNPTEPKYKDPLADIQDLAGIRVI